MRTLGFVVLILVLYASNVISYRHGYRMGASLCIDHKE